jgi:triosephosphate isomerase
MAVRRPLIAGNWKMNGLQSDGLPLARGIAALNLGGRDVLICPPFTMITSVCGAVAGSAVLVGGQDCHAKPSGAHTGDVSARMLHDAGARWVIVGHSERRADHGETDVTVLAKAQAAQGADLGAIICIGETLAEREAGRTLQVLSTQLAGSVPAGAAAARTVVAYEPVWAIGTGKTPTVAEVAAAHAHIRQVLGAITPEAETIRVLYGGSVKGSNAAELLAVANVDGALVGGASLKIDEFAAIIAAARAV